MAPSSGKSTQKIRTTHLEMEKNIHNPKGDRRNKIREGNDISK